MPNLAEIKERKEILRPLTVIPQLIGIDGIDGAGKTTIAQALAQAFSQQIGPDKVVTFSIVNLKEGHGQQRLAQIARKGNLTGERLNMFYIAGLNRGYSELVIPALELGQIVILDKTELDLLRFTIEAGNDKSIRKRETLIRNGIATCGLWLEIGFLWMPLIKMY